MSFMNKVSENMTEREVITPQVVGEGIVKSLLTHPFSTSPFTIPAPKLTPETKITLKTIIREAEEQIAFPFVETPEDQITNLKKEISDLTTRLNTFETRMKHLEKKNGLIWLEETANSIAEARAHL